MRMKRITVFILMVAILATMLGSIISYAAESPHDHYTDCTQIPEFYSATDSFAVDYWDSIKGSLPQGAMPTIIRNGSKYPFNFRIWHDKGLIVYGNYNICNNGVNDWKAATQRGGPGSALIENEGYYFNFGEASFGEYRYHGLTSGGDKFTNLDFPADDYLSREASNEWIEFPWNSDMITPTITQSLYSYSANQNENVTTREWINKAIPFTIYEQSGTAYKYLHIQQAPSIQYPGQGRMWHFINGSLWYQSFSIPRMDSATKIATKTSDIELTITVSNIEKELAFIDYKDKSDNDVIEVRATVEATLLDDSYYNNEVDKVNRYTRNDIGNWVIGLNGETKVVNKWSDNTAKAEFIIPLMKSQIKALQGHKILLSAKAQAIFLDNAKSPEKSSITYTQFIIDNELVIPDPPDLVEPVSNPDFQQPLPFDIEPNIPQTAFDTIKFLASENTDMDYIDSREVFVDGIRIDDNAFFTGNYVFGEDKIGLRQIAINYTSKDEQKGQIIKWVMVYSTKPRAQFKLDGTLKQMRKLSVTNTTVAANAAIVNDAYPITSYQWQFTSVSGDITTLKTRTGATDIYKEFLYKKSGTYKITLTATNSLGKVSDSYELQLVIAPDIAPAIEINLDNSVMGRNETIKAYHYLVSSTDGDVITNNNLELWYDSNNDGRFDTLIGNYDGNIGFPAYTPTKLGRYKYINRVKEDYGQDTLQEFVTTANKLEKTYEVEFFVDNYIPMTSMYLDTPAFRPQVDVYFMNDFNLDSSKNNYILSGRVNFGNFLRSKNILPQINVWDMKSYTYSQPASTSVHSGSSYPPASTLYTSGGYSGTLYRNSISDNGYYYDYGRYETRTESKTVSEGYSDSGAVWYFTGYGTTYAGSYPASSKSYSDSNGYSGTLSMTNYVYSSRAIDDPSGQYEYLGFTWSRNCTYVGVVSRNITVWVPDWRWISDYTGYYSGTIYNYVRQPYIDPFRATTQKFVIYFSDNSISQLSDLQMVMSKSDAKFILIGQDSIKNQIEYDYFILNNKPVEQLVQQALEYVTQQYPVVQKYYILTGQDNIMLNTSNYDEENDPIIEEKFQYVHNPNYFDNSMGIESFAANSFSSASNWTDFKATQFTKPGKYQIYRRIKDNPSNDPVFSAFSYYSGIPEVIVYVHRKPLALAELNWDYDQVNNQYITNWVDKSYDPDHQYNRADKGIIERKIMYRRNGGEWTYKIPDKLTPGNYELLYYVRDAELAWSDAYTMNFTLNSIPLMQFDGKLKSQSGSFTLSGIPVSENLEAYDLWTRFPYTHHLEMVLRNSYGAVTPVKVVYLSDSTGSKNGNDVTWGNISYQIPTDLADGNYSCRITAIGDYGQTSYKDYGVIVNTPVNLSAMINGSSYGVQIQADEISTFTFETSTYVNSVRLNFKGQSYFSNSGAVKLISNDGVQKTWEIKLTAPSGSTLDVETGAVEFTAYVPSGKSETVNVDYEIITIQAYDFTVTSILDVNWRGFYFDLTKPINGNGALFGFPRRASTEIKSTQIPVNYLGLISYVRTSVQAGCMVKGYIRLKGSPDSVTLSTLYYQNGVLKTGYPIMTNIGNGVYGFEWIIPQATDQSTFVYINISICKGANTYGSEKWKEVWPISNLSRAVFYVKGSVMDNVEYNQSN